MIWVFLAIAILYAEAYNWIWHDQSFVSEQWLVLARCLDRIPEIFANGTLLILIVCCAIIISTMRNLDLKIKNTSIAFILALMSVLMLIADIFDLNLRLFVLLANICSIYIGLVIITTPYEKLRPSYLKFSEYLVNLVNWLIYKHQTVLSFLFAVSLFQYPTIFMAQIWFAAIIVTLTTYIQPLIGLYLALVLVLYILILKYPIWQNYSPTDRRLSLVESCWYYDSILAIENSNNLVQGFFILIMRHSTGFKAPLDDLDSASSSSKWPFGSSIRTTTLQFEHASIRFNRLGLSSKITYTVFAASAISVGGGFLLATKYSRDKTLARIQKEMHKLDVEREIAIQKLDVERDIAIQKLEAQRDAAIKKMEVERDIVVTNNNVRLAEIELAKLNAQKKDLINSTSDSGPPPDMS